MAATYPRQPRSPHQLGSLAVWVDDALMEQSEPNPLEALIADVNEIASGLALLEADAGLLLERANLLAMQLALLETK
jgi:hypothetical protein